MLKNFLKRFWWCNSSRVVIFFHLMDRVPLKQLICASGDTVDVGGFWWGGGLVVRGGCRWLSFRGCRFCPAPMAEGIAIRQRGPALRAEVHGSGSFVWGDKGWGFLFEGSGGWRRRWEVTQHPLNDEMYHIFTPRPLAFIISC